MQVASGPMGSQLQKSYALKTQTDYRTLPGVAVTFIPKAAFGLQQVRMLGGEAVETGTAETIFTFDDEAKTSRQFAKGFLIGLDRGQTSQQIAFTVGGAPRIKFPVDNARGEWPNRPVR